MTPAERQKNYRSRKAMEPSNVTPPQLQPVTCGNCQVLADELARLKRELAEGPRSSRAMEAAAGAGQGEGQGRRACPHALWPELSGDLLPIGEGLMTAGHWTMMGLVAIFVACVGYVVRVGR